MHNQLEAVGKHRAHHRYVIIACRRRQRRRGAHIVSIASRPIGQTNDLYGKRRWVSSRNKVRHGKIRDSDSAVWPLLKARALGEPAWLTRWTSPNGDDFESRRRTRSLTQRIDKPRDN